MAIRTREGGDDEVFRSTPLDAPYEVMAIAPALRSYFSGQMIGMLEGCAILIWPNQSAGQQQPRGLADRILAPLFATTDQQARNYESRIAPPAPPVPHF